METSATLLSVYNSSCTGRLLDVEVPADVVENERRIAEETAKAEGKPEKALPKIVEGRLTGFFKDSVLIDQPFVKDSKKTVKNVLDEAGATVKAFTRFEVGQS